MDMQHKTPWEQLPEAHRTAWLQHVVNFYPPNTVSPQEAAELAREEYTDADSDLPPVSEACETE